MSELKLSLTAFLEAGYQLLHIDPTVDRTLPAGTSPAVETIVARTVELIAYAENERKRLGLPPISYEVGSEEVHGGLVDMGTFNRYLKDLKSALAAHGLEYVWPCFIVAQVGTNLHTTFFDAKAARQLFEIVSPLGSLIKGHYTDFVDNPREYPLNGMGGANVARSSPPWNIRRSKVWKPRKPPCTLPVPPWSPRTSCKPWKQPSSLRGVGRNGSSRTK